MDNSSGTVMEDSYVKPVYAVFFSGVFKGAYETQEQADHVLALCEDASVKSVEAHESTGKMHDTIIKTAFVAPK